MASPQDSPGAVPRQTPRSTAEYETRLPRRKPQDSLDATPPGFRRACVCCGTRRPGLKRRTFGQWVNDPLTHMACSEFSLHALPRAFAQDLSCFRRLLWLLLFLVGGAMTVVTVVSTVMDYLDFESMTSIVNEAPGPDGIVFPAATIWNHNPARRSFMNQTRSAREYCARVGDLNEDGVHSGKPFPEPWDVDMSWKVAHPIEDMIVRCEWAGKPCGKEIFFPALTPAPNTRWGIGYSFNHLSDQRSRQAGRPGGLHLVLDIQTEQYCPAVWDRGFRVQFHDHEDLPEKVSAAHINPLLGDSISPGYRWSFAIKRVESHSLGLPYASECINLRGGEKYPNPNYARECASECPDVEEEDINEVSLLSTSDECVIECFRPRSYRFCDGVTFPFSLGRSKITVPDFDEVDSQLLKNLKDSFVARFVPENALDMSPDELRAVLQQGVDKNIVTVDFYYKEMLTERHVETPQESFWGTIGEVGGLIGLFLGASLITGFEFVEILVMLFCGYADVHLHQKSLAAGQESLGRASELVPVPTSRSIVKKYALSRHTRATFASTESV